MGSEMCIRDSAWRGPPPLRPTRRTPSNSRRTLVPSRGARNPRSTGRQRIQSTPAGPSALALRRRSLSGYADRPLACSSPQIRRRPAPPRPTRSRLRPRGCRPATTARTQHGGGHAASPPPWRGARADVRAIPRPPQSARRARANSMPGKSQFVTRLRRHPYSQARNSSSRSARMGSRSPNSREAKRSSGLVITSASGWPDIGPLSCPPLSLA